MIVSASRRTDLPAFFGRWLLDRIHAGWVDVNNPFNPHQRRRVSLRPGDVTAFVFWTKNPQSFTELLDRLDERGFRYYFQFTLNAYGPELEPELPAHRQRLDTFARLSDRLGPERVIWRYDPIALSTQTPIDFHRRAFDSLSQRLEDRTRRVMVSLVEYYRKIDRRLRGLEARGVRFEREAAGDQRTYDLLSELSAMAKSRSIEMLSCASAVDYSTAGVLPGACIDSALIRTLWNISVPTTKDPGQRKHCRCAKSRDIGTNDTCDHRCLYCYANR